MGAEGDELPTTQFSTLGRNSVLSNTIILSFRVTEGFIQSDGHRRVRKLPGILCPNEHPHIVREDRSFFQRIEYREDHHPSNLLRRIALVL